jgi:threonine/homoserine/homoserine lactone efflux protein
MPTPEVLATVFAASLMLAFTPGPDNLFVLTQAALRGSAAGLMVVLGLCTGLILHTSLVAFGAAAIFQTSAVAFSALKYLGAAYLIYLAWGAFRADAARLDGERVELHGLGAMYRRGIVMNATNPKVSIFFLAFLPQFAEPERGSVAVQIVVFAGAFLLATLLVFGGIAIAAGKLGAWLRTRPGVQRGMNRMAGLVLLGLAVSLLVSEAPSGS